MEHSDLVKRLIQLFDEAPYEWQQMLLEKLEARFAKPEPEYDKDEEY